MYALHILCITNTYICIYIFIRNPIITGTLHILVLSKWLFRYLNVFLKLDFSQLVYICRFYDVYSNVDSSITWTRFAKMSCLLHFLILTLPRKVFHFDSSMQAICCDITDYLTSDMRAKPYQECNKQHVWPHYYL